MTESRSLRIVVFGATGHLGQELIDALDESDWPIAELLGVASEDSAGLEFDFRGESLDVVGEWPLLKGRDLVLVCTPTRQALEIVRESLRAEVPCIDCSGALADQADVPLVVTTSTAFDAEAIAKAPLVSVASGTTLAWTPIVESLAIQRLIGTVFSSASARGRGGIVALSQESIAVFNQSDAPDLGPAGQAVAFDVIPGGGIDCDRVSREMARLFGEGLGVSLASVQVPTFVGEGASIALELAEPLGRDELATRLADHPGLSLVRDGLGSRGLAAVGDDAVGPIGPTLRDAIGSDEILVGRIIPDPSLPEGRGWRIWIASDPLRLVAAEALRIASWRLGRA